jgi:hypothetical protein
LDIKNLPDDAGFGSLAGVSTAEKREIIRESLPGLASELTMLMRDANLEFPILLCIPGGGNGALLSMATPLSPNDSEWAVATTICCSIVTRILGGTKMYSRPLECAMANATVSAVDVIVDEETEQ